MVHLSSPGTMLQKDNITLSKVALDSSSCRL